MPDKLVLFFLFLAGFACFAALFDIVGGWIYELIDFKKDGKSISFTILPRGSGEANSSRGWK